MPAGAFQMGEGEEEHEVTLPEFRISRHPITNAQYADFVEGGGYEKRDYWREADAAGFWEGGRFKGQFDEKARTGPVAYAGSANPDHPVVGVTWYEALAYTRWLTEVARDAGDLPKGEVVTLPSEAEWEKAARGEDAREYPWGDEFEPDRCNVEESRIGSTSPVGSYPTGASPFGVEDMAGNVWEWTRSLYRDYPYRPGDGREGLDAGPDESRVLRGGSFGRNAGLARCAYRGWDLPYLRAGSIGFRVVASPSGGA